MTPYGKKNRIVGVDNFLWNYFTQNPQTGGLCRCVCDSFGVPIKDFVIESVDELPLTVMDSALFDIPETKVEKGGIRRLTGAKVFMVERGIMNFHWRKIVPHYQRGFLSAVPMETLREFRQAVMRLAWQRLAVKRWRKKTFEVNYGEIAYNNPCDSVRT